MLLVLAVAPVVVMAIPNDVLRLNASDAAESGSLYGEAFDGSPRPADDAGALNLAAAVAQTPPLGALRDGAGLVEEPEPTTTTTTWQEPEVEPESSWVDAGHGVLVPDLMLRVRFCESTNNYASSHRLSSASGAYQFLSGSWDWYGHAEAYGVERAADASPAQQDQAALDTWRQDGFRPWAESRRCWDNPNITANYASALPRTTTTEATEGTSTSTTAPTTPEATTTSESQGPTPTASPETPSTPTTPTSEPGSSTSTSSSSTVATVPPETDPPDNPSEGEPTTAPNAG